MHKDSFDFVHNAEGDYYDLVVDKKIQKVVEELKAPNYFKKGKVIVKID